MILLLDLLLGIALDGDLLHALARGAEDCSERETCDGRTISRTLERPPTPIAPLVELRRRRRRFRPAARCCATST